MARTKELIGNVLASLGVPCANETWWPDKPPALPYVILCCEGISTRQSDNLNHSRVTRYRLELYTHGRDEALESAMETAFTHCGLSYGMRPVGIIDQTDVYEMQFTLTVIGD